MLETYKVPDMEMESDKFLHAFGFPEIAVASVAPLLGFFHPGRVGDFYLRLFCRSGALVFLGQGGGILHALVRVTSVV